MNMRNVTLGAVLAASTLAFAAPLAAQPPAGWDKEAFWAGAPAGIWERIGFLQTRIDRGIARHHLNRTEATRAQNELGRIRQMTVEMRTRDGGTLNDTDRTYLQDRLDQLSSTIHWMAHNGW
jgi:hypothetical protein